MVLYLEPMTRQEMCNAANGTIRTKRQNAMEPEDEPMRMGWNQKMSQWERNVPKS